MLPCYDLDVLTGKSNFLHQIQKPVLPFSRSTPERSAASPLQTSQLKSVRCHCREGSTSARLPRRWVIVPVRKYGVSVRKLVSSFFRLTADFLQNLCNSGMYALRERRQYVGQEDFEMAVAKVLKKNAEGNTSVNKLFS